MSSPVPSSRSSRRSSAQEDQLDEIAMEKLIYYQNQLRKETAQRQKASRSKRRGKQKKGYQGLNSIQEEDEEDDNSSENDGYDEEEEDYSRQDRSESSKGLGGNASDGDNEDDMDEDSEDDSRQVRRLENRRQDRPHYDTQMFDHLTSHSKTAPMNHSPRHTGSRQRSPEPHDHMARKRRRVVKLNEFEMAQKGIKPPGVGNLPASDNEPSHGDSRRSEVTLQYYARKSGPPVRRKAPKSVSRTWIDAYAPFFDKHPNRKQRLLKGERIEHVLPGYSSRSDPWAFLLLSVPRAEWQVRLAERIRTHCEMLRFQETSLEIHPDARLSSDRKSEYQFNPTALKCTATQFALDFDDTTESPWNKQAINVAVKNFLEKKWHDIPGMDLSFLTAPALRAHYAEHVKGLLRKHKKASLQRNLNDQLQDADLARYMRARHQKFVQRRETCENIPDLYNFFHLLSELGSCAHSDEETDHEFSNPAIPRKKVYTIPWRSARLESLLHFLDKERKRRLSNPLWVPAGTKPPQEFQLTYVPRTGGEITKNVFPIGMPIQVYDRDWLESMKQEKMFDIVNPGPPFPQDFPRRL